MMYWNCILVGKGWREFKSESASIMKIAPSSPVDQEHVNTVQVVELVLENHQDAIQDLSIALEWFVKCVANIDLVQLGHSSVCPWWVTRYVMEVHRNLCLQVLFHFFSYLKEEQTGSLNLWWRCETWFHHCTQNGIKCSGHICLHSEPQNIKCASMLEAVAPLFYAAGFIIVVFMHWDPKVNVNICCYMPCWLH